MKVTVFGIGYVGLVQAAVLAEVGHHVMCIDIDEQKVNKLKQGIVPIYEPELELLVQRNQQQGRLQFSTDPQRGVRHAGIQFIAVGTPPDEDGSADLHYVTDVAHTIASHMEEDKIVVDKSTVPVGTADKVRQVMQHILQTRGVKYAVDVVSNPEFLKEGAAVADCMRPERIIVGTDNPDAAEVLRELYQPFNRNHDRMLIMDVRSAELTKYAANGMLATKISFMNEIASLAERLGADVEKVRQGIGSDSRIGYHFIYPGCGYGGSCFPKDVQALIRTAEQTGYQPHLLRAVESVNQRQKQKLAGLVCQHYGEDLTGKTFALWGLAFKPNTDDVREAASRVVMETLWQKGARIQAYDPKAAAEIQRVYPAHPRLSISHNKEAALQGADALIICTEWQEFRAPEFDIVKSSLKQPVIFDGRNLYDPEKLRHSGFIYYAMGRGASVNKPK